MTEHIQGVTATPPGHSGSAPSPVPGLGHPASVPNAGEGEISYRLNPHFRQFMRLLGGDVGLAAVAWNIAREAFVPSTPEADFEVWQGDDMVAGCSGPRGRALAEAVHYAVVYQTDDSPCTIQEVTRREISPDTAHDMLASGIEARRGETGTGSVHESPVGEAETQ